MSKWVRWFVVSAGMILLITGLAKIVSAFGKALVLTQHDPVFQISFKNLMLFSGILELALSIFCFIGKNITLQAGLVAWLATCFLFYRLGIFWGGFNRPCPCLGNLTDALHISPRFADAATKIALTYLLIGSSVIYVYRKFRCGSYN